MWVANAPQPGQNTEKSINKKSYSVSFFWFGKFPRHDIHISTGMTRIGFVLHVSVVPPGSEYDEEEVDYEESDSDESWTTESAISSESILSSMCMNGGEEKPFACPVPGCKKRYKVRLHQRMEKSFSKSAMQQ